MTLASTSVSQAELIRVNDGNALAWPVDPLKAALFALYLHDRLKAFIPAERLSLAYLMGGFGEGTTDQKMTRSIRRVAMMNSLHLHLDLPTGIAGLIWLIKTPVDQWPHEPSKYAKHD